MILLCSHTSLHRQYINNRLLEACCQQIYILYPLLHTHTCILAHLLAHLARGTRFLSRAFGKMQHSRLETTKAKIVCATQPGPGETIGCASHYNRFILLAQFFLSLLRGKLDSWPSRVTQTKNTSDLVKCLTSSVITSTP